MNSFTLIYRNMSRKRLRSVLLALSIAIAFFIFAVLASFENSFNGAPVQSERLVVSSKLGNARPLPISMANKIAQLKEVGLVTYHSYFRATYQNPSNFIGVNAVELPSYAKYFSGQYTISDQQIAAMKTQRDGLLVGQAIAQREGWEVGQKVVLKSPFERKVDGTSNWSFKIVGIFKAATPAIDTNFVVMHYDYYNAGRAYNKDSVADFGILPAKGFTSDQTIDAVDARFANSADETLTRTESAFMKAFIEQIADVATIVRLVVGAAFITILMIAANTMFFAIRERTTEIGVLKVIGFSQGYILRAVLAETILIFAIGSAIGLAVAAVACNFLSAPLSAIIPSLVLTPKIIMQAIAAAFGFSLITGGIPAINAMRIPSTAALKGC